MRPRRAICRRSCGPAPVSPTSPITSYENRVSSGLDIAVVHSLSSLTMEHSLTTSIMSEHARRWGALWGSEPDAWAATEAQQAPVYEAALHAVGLPRGARVLDVGC